MRDQEVAAFLVGVHRAVLLHELKMIAGCMTLPCRSNQRSTKTRPKHYQMLAW